MSWLSAIIDEGSKRASRALGTSVPGINLGFWSANQAGRLLNIATGQRKEAAAPVDSGITQAIARQKKQVEAADMDDTTKQELLSRLNSNQYSQIETIQKDINDAISGGGKYASRLRNYKAFKVFTDRPGSSQLFSSSASRAGAANGILTPSQTGMLTPKG